MAACGGAGQSCCASNQCNSGLACTTGDQVCRATEVWFAANTGNTSGMALIGRGNGTSFTLTPIGTGSPTAIWGTAANDIWVVAQGPNNPTNNAQRSWARHWNGNTWEAQVDFPEGFTVYGLWGDAPNNYWAVTNAGTAFHWTGSSWGQPQTIVAGAVFTQIWGSSATNIWALAGNRVAHWDGSGSWSVMNRSDFSTSGGASGITGRKSGQMFASGSDPIGAQAAVLIWDGSAYSTSYHGGTAQDCQKAVAIWAGSDDVWTLITGGAICSTDTTVDIKRYANNTWSSEGVLTNAGGFVFWMWGTSNKDLYVSGRTSDGTATLFRYDGMNWTAPYFTSQASYLGPVWTTGRP